jgi:hypothetical protein
MLRLASMREFVHGWSRACNGRPVNILKLLALIRLARLCKPLVEGREPEDAVQRLQRFRLEPSRAIGSDGYGENLRYPVKMYEISTKNAPAGHCPA